MSSLVIAEKPSVARSIASVLGAKSNKDGYLEGNGYVVSWCIGHLVELSQPEEYREDWKKWSYDTLPIMPESWKYAVKADTKKQFDILKSLMDRADVLDVICATDAGREGELIFRLVYNQAGCYKPMKRLWISSMEESAIKDGFAHLKPGRDYDNLYNAALARAQADWLVGLNGTRLFTVLYQGKTLKVGRVQTPTLSMICDREAEIMGFKKEQYFKVHILSGALDAVSENIKDKAEADRVSGMCMGQNGSVVSVTKDEKTTTPPKLYDLTTLQRDANRLFGFTAKQTLEYTQSLYEKKLVTYPRTDSQYLSDDMVDTAVNVIEAVKSTLFTTLNGGLSPDVGKVLNSKKVTDHHAIIPTMEITKADLLQLPEGEKKILYLAGNRLLCATGEKHKFNSVKVEVIVNGVKFTSSGRTILDNGWKTYEDALKQAFSVKPEKEDSDEEEKSLPELSQGQILSGVQTNVSEHFTKPKSRFTEDSLLSAMERAGSADMEDDVERKGLGTPATRADIIEKLVKDGFIRRDKKKIVPTEDGMKLVTVLPDVVKSPLLTAEWENKLSQVAKGQLSMGSFMDGIKSMVRNLVATYHGIGDEEKGMFAPKREALGKCPKCGNDVAKGKFGAYCTGKCGLLVSKAMGVNLTDGQVKSALEGKRFLLKGLKSKKGSTYDAFMIPDGIEERSYEKNGQMVTAYQIKYNMEFPKKKEK